MRITFDHGGFQRGAATVVACGGAGAMAAAVAGVGAAVASMVSVGAAALPLGLGVYRAARDGRLLLSTVSAVAAIGGAWLVWWTPGAEEAPAALAAAGLGLLAGLAASLGLIGCHLRITRDVLGEAIEAARPDLDGASMALCTRAAAAAAKISSAAGKRAAGGAEARRAATEVEAVARRVVLEIVALSRRQRAVAREAAAPSSAELDARIADIDARLAGVTDEVTRDGYKRAQAAIEDQRRRLGTLRVTADRVMARLHTEVAALEGAALAIAARGGAATAEDAAALAPLADRLRGASGEVELEAEAAREVAAM